MKRMLPGTTIAALALAMILGTALAVAQDARVPGEENSVPLGANVRNGKLVFQTADTSYRWWFDSRVQFDAAKYFQNKNELSDGATFRRLTFAMKALMGKYWEAEIDLDFAEQVSAKSQIKMRDAFIKWTVPNVDMSFQAGNFKEPFGLEELNSSRLLTFMERSAISSAIPLGRRVGIAGHYWTDYGQVTAAFMGHETGTRVDKGQSDEGYSTNLRLSGALINKHGHNLHIGAAGSYKTPDVTTDFATLNTIDVSGRVETYVFTQKFLHTGDITDVNYYTRYCGELMYINGPLYVQSEYMAEHIVRWYGKAPITVGGGYLTLAYVITGETRDYYADEGEVGPIETAKSSWGALELAARYSISDLNDLSAGIHGGRSNQMMFGINYYPITNIKIQLNYSRIDLDQYATRKGNLIGDDDFSFIQMRFQASL